MTANWQGKHTFKPIPRNAKILYEKEGVRKVQLENGVILRLLSEQEQVRRAKQQPYTLEQRQNAKPLEVIVPDGPGSAPSPEIQPQQREPVKAPGKPPKKHPSTLPPSHPYTVQNL